MSIGLQQTGEFADFGMGVAGTLTTSSVSKTWMASTSFVLKGVLAQLGTAGGTQATIVDVLKNGTTIFASGKINFATSTATPTYGPLTNALTTLVKGDILKVTVTQVGSGAAPADLGVAIAVAKYGATKLPAATSLGSL